VHDGSNDADSGKGVPLGVLLIGLLLPISGVKYFPPKRNNCWGVLIQTGKILRVFYYQNYCIDFNQIWQKDKDHQVVNPRVPLVVWEAASVDLGILPSSHRGRVKHTTALRQDWDHCSQHSTNG